MSEEMNSTTINPIMPTYNRFPITLKSGKGSYVWDEDGNKYLDYTAGIATCNLGHVPDAVEQQVQKQLTQLWHCSNLYHIPSQQRLAELLAENSCGDQVFFCNSGAEANEAAIKLARKYASMEENGGAHEIVTFTNSFHGRTLATLSATGQEKIQQGFQPLLSGFRHLPYNDMESLKDVVGPKTCAVFLELIQGEGGVIPADPEWITQLAQLCKENNILLMVDEIQTGMGRTGSLFAYEQYGIEPDVISTAKGLGSGIPIGAIIAKEHVAKAFSPGTHGSTFGGNPIATTAGLATVTYLLENNVLSNVNQMSTYLFEKLNQLSEKFDKINAIHGKGLLVGISVKDNAIDYVHKAREHKLLILVAGPNVIRVLPPLTTKKEEVEEFLSIIEEVFAAV